MVDSSGILGLTDAAARSADVGGTAAPRGPLLPLAAVLGPLLIERAPGRGKERPAVFAGRIDLVIARSGQGLYTCP